MQLSRRHNDVIKNEDEDPNDLNYTKYADTKNANPSTSDHNHKATDPRPTKTEVLLKAKSYELQIIFY
ncbi:hypothetical protein NL676_016104 [Syzygium grande]|nr:hypothetical protein NL676_016104 [Syzygium grande]